MSGTPEHVGTSIGNLMPPINGTSGFERVGPIRPVSGSRSVRAAESTLPQLSGSIPSLAFGGSKDLRAEEGILHCAGHAQLSGLLSSCRSAGCTRSPYALRLTPPYRTVSTWPVVELCRIRQNINNPTEDTVLRAANEPG